MSTLTEPRVQSDAATITLFEAAEFIWREGEILDRQDYADWLPLWTDDGLYVIPIERADGDYANALNIAYDDAEMRAARVKRLKSGFSISSAPSARTIRSASRFVMGGVADGAAVVRCAQTIVEYKFERTRTLAADVTFHLVRRNGAIAIARKEVLFVNSDDFVWGIGYLP